MSLLLLHTDTLGNQRNMAGVIFADAQERFGDVFKKLEQADAIAARKLDRGIVQDQAMIWWRPTYPAPRYRTWSWRRPFTLDGATLARFFLVSRLPEPLNDRDEIRW